MTESARRVTTASIYSDFDQVIRNVERWVATEGPSVRGFADDIVRRRIVQRIVQLTVDSYCRRAVGWKSDVACEGRAPRRIFVGGVHIDTETGAVSVPARQWLQQIGLFAAVWLQTLLGLVPGLFARSPQVNAATVVLDPIGEADADRHGFSEFCAHGPVGVLTAATCVIVPSANESAAEPGSKVVHATRPLIRLANDSGSWPERAVRVLRILWAPIGLVAAVFRAPLNVLISRDLALTPLLGDLDHHHRLEALVTTTSSFTQQPLWAHGSLRRGFKLHTVWYSQNFIPKRYIGDPQRESLPSARHMRADHNWVWTEGFARYLSSLNSEAINHVVGPILWYLPTRDRVFGDAPVKIAVFDITPQPDGATPFGAVRNYYSVEGMKRFVEDILSVALQIEKQSGRAVEVLLKHKRLPKVGLHDSDYLSWLDALTERTPQLRLVDHRANLFAFLAEADVAVSVPYTSTAYVSSSLGRPAVYYDFTGELVAEHEPHEHVHFVQSRDSLADMMRRCLT